MSDEYQPLLDAVELAAEMSADELNALRGPFMSAFDDPSDVNVEFLVNAIAALGE